MTDVLLNLTGFPGLILRFAINLIAAVTLVRYIYLRIKDKREFAFAFLLSNVLIFFLCYLMSGAQISMGFAFGLFAVFGILRYRTTTLPIKEMTYLFASIALALINGLANQEMSLFELLFINISILAVVFILERVWSVEKKFTKRVSYERIDLLEAGDAEAILADLRQRTGLNIIAYTVKNINLVEGVADLRAEYKPDEN